MFAKIFLKCDEWFCLQVCEYITYMPGAHRSQEMVLDPQELKLFRVVRHHVDARHLIWVLCKSS